MVRCASFFLSLFLSLSFSRFACAVLCCKRAFRLRKVEARDCVCSGAVFVLEWQKVRRDFVRALFFAIFSLSFYVSLSLSLPSESFPVRKLGGQRRDVWGAGEEENGYWTSLGCLKKDEKNSCGSEAETTRREKKNRNCLNFPQKKKTKSNAQTRTRNRLFLLSSTRKWHLLSRFKHQRCPRGAR
jgi:hypothetical protein